MPRLNDCRRVFFSFPQVTDPQRHKDYNTWHQLDHQPENRALDAVLHGDRWVRTPQCRTASPSADDAAVGAADYVAMYWFADPVEDSVAEWFQLGQTTLELGRRPDLKWTTRRLSGYFRPLDGRVSDGVRISASALPYRAHAGVLLEVLRVAEPRSAQADAAAREWHHELLPAVRRHDGVLGTWTFASRDVTVVGDEAERHRAPGQFLVALHFCETDPVTLAAALDRPTPAGTEVLLRTPLETVVPFAWDWFDA